MLENLLLFGFVLLFGSLPLYVIILIFIGIFTGVFAPKTSEEEFEEIIAKISKFEAVILYIAVWWIIVCLGSFAIFGNGSMRIIGPVLAIVLLGETIHLTLAEFDINPWIPVPGENKIRQLIRFAGRILVGPVIPKSQWQKHISN